MQYVSYDLTLAASPIKSEDSEGKTKKCVGKEKHCVAGDFFVMLFDVSWRKTYRK